MKSIKFFIVLAAAFFLMSARAQELLNYPLDTVNGEEVYRYEVEKSIGLYRIGINFNVSQSDIVRLNPQLKERGLHYGETLLIPTGRPVEEKPKEERWPMREVVKEKLKSDSLRLRVDTLKYKKIERLDIAEWKNPNALPWETDSVTLDSAAIDSISADTVQYVRQVVELALMLPFESQQTKRSGNADRMLEFYEGALLALRDLQNDSTLYQLRVYDTERSERKVNELCDSTELDSVRGILGLVYPIQIERMANWCEVHQVPLMLPFCDDVDLALYSQVLQFNSTDQQEADSLCAWMKKQEHAHFVTIDVREGDMSSSIRTLRKQMKSNELNHIGLALRDLMNDSAAFALDKNAENIIIPHSDRYQHVRMLIPHLTKLKEAGYRIRIVSQYSWQKENIALPQVYTSMFTAESDRTEFDSLWAESFKNGHVSEAPRYDLLGYDLMKALIARLRGEDEVKGLQSEIRWKKVDKGGYQNECVKVVEK